MQLPPNKASALEVNSLFFNTGKPCHRGHLSKRYTSIGKCYECGKIESAARHHKLYKSDSSYADAKRKAAREQHKREGTKWYHDNKPRAAALNKLWREANKDSFKGYTVQWRRDNLDKLTKNAAAYRSSKIQATPTWANPDAIQAFYTEAARMTLKTGIKYTVDHIIPLNSDVVCGLHVEHNLQLLTLSDNSKKSNKL